MKKIILFLSYIIIVSHNCIYADLWKSIKKDAKSAEKTGSDIANNTQDAIVYDVTGKTKPVPVFNPPTNKQLRASLAKMTDQQRKDRLTFLQKDVVNLGKKIQDRTSRIKKLILESGMPGAVIGGVLGTLGGTAAAAGVTLISGGALAPTACGMICMGAAVGAAAGTEAFSQAIDGYKITYYQNEIKESTKQWISEGQEIQLLHAYVTANMTPAQIQALTNDKIKKLSKDIINYIIVYMTPSQIASLEPEFIASLNNLQVQDLTHQQIQAITAKQISAIPPNITPDQKSKIENFNSKLDEALKSAGKDPKKLNAAFKDMSDLFKEIFKVLNEAMTAIAELKTFTITSFLPHQIAIMTKDQILAISPLQIQVMSPAQIAAIAPNIMHDIKPEQIGLLTPFQILALTKAQQKELTAEQQATLAFIVLAENIAGMIINEALCWAGGGAADVVAAVGATGVGTGAVTTTNTKN